MRLKWKVNLAVWENKIEHQYGEVKSSKQMTDYEGISN
jgi:hypothetical protein